MNGHGSLVALEASDVAIVELCGEHDLASVRDVRGPLEEALCRGDDLILDLERTTFIDSAVVGVILQAGRVADLSGRGMFFVCAPLGSHPRRVLDLVAAGDHVTIVESRVAALYLLQQLRQLVCRRPDLDPAHAALGSRVAEGRGEP